jgi:hypothetical protein
LRYWDGQRWTDDVSDGGVVSKDAPAAPAQPQQPVQPAQPEPPVDPNATYAGGVLPPVPQTGATPAATGPSRPVGSDPADQASAFLSGLPEIALIGVAAALAVLVGFIGTVFLSTILGLEPDPVFFTTRFFGDGAKRLFGALFFGALLGAAIVGGRALVDAVKAKAFDTALMPLAKGAIAGAAAGFVVQVIGFKILDEFADALAGDIPDPIFFAIYLALQWALFGAVLGAVALAPIGGPDPAAKKRLPYLAAAGAVGGLIAGFILEVLFDFGDLGLFSALLEILIVTALLGAAAAAASSDQELTELLPVGGAGGRPSGPGGAPGAAPAAPASPAQPPTAAPAQPPQPAAPAQPAPPQAAAQPEGWYPDPSGRHQTRWWDGRQWTSHVADNGVQSTDPG